MRRIPVIICIDVEPKEREISSAIAKDWAGVEETFKFFSNLRPRMEAATRAPVTFSWFFRMDPQIEHTYGLSEWVVKRYGEAIKQLELAGDEIGLHTHAWRWDDGRQKWVIDHGDQRWIDHCLRTSFEAYQSAFGRPCLSFRFGDHWMNNETMGLLESLGVKFDLTLEPGRKTRPALILDELYTGSLPDYMTVPRWPYRPSRKDFRRRSHAQDRGLWVIPLSTGREVGRFARLKRAARALGIDLQRRYEAHQLNLSGNAELFHGRMDSLLSVWSKSYLALVVRTDACTDSTSRAHMEQNLNFLLSHPLVNRFKFVRPAEAIELLTCQITSSGQRCRKYWGRSLCDFQPSSLLGSQSTMRRYMLLIYCEEQARNCRRGSPVSPCPREPTGEGYAASNSSPRTALYCRRDCSTAGGYYGVDLTDASGGRVGPIVRPKGNIHGARRRDRGS